MQIWWNLYLLLKCFRCLIATAGWPTKPEPEDANGQDGDDDKNNEGAGGDDDDDDDDDIAARGIH